jgi:hypothetical protein
MLFGVSILTVPPQLHRQIGKLKVENDFLARRLGF